jgi:peptidoglycan/xylan/chitin deacetylase (PgdA/CDA1 family)
LTSSSASFKAAAAGFIIACLVIPALARDQQRTRQVAVTVDDLPASRAAFPGSQACDFAALQSATGEFLRLAAAHRVPLVGFVNEGKACPQWEPGALAGLLETWLDEGAEIGNHTYSHRDLYNTTLDAYKADIIRGEATSSIVLAKRKQRLRYFRHPYLHEGLDPGVHKELLEFLSRRGYEVAPVTVDNQDWMFSEVYARAKQRHDQATMSLVLDAYLRYLDEIFASAEKLSNALLSYELPQILLLHATALNFDHFERVVEVIAQRGYEFIPLEAALKNRIYRTPLPSKGSWLRSWAARQGTRPEPGPRVADFLGTLYRDYSAAPPETPAAALSVRNHPH